MGLAPPALVDTPGATKATITVTIGVGGADETGVSSGWIDLLCRCLNLHDATSSSCNLSFSLIYCHPLHLSSNVDGGTSPYGLISPLRESSKSIG